ncbi:hypothetical protein [Maritimibacter sp. 55A14]|nr:hypothetical protein [Maritimibacter sp. 55A14]
MSKYYKLVLALGLVSFAAACAQQEEEVVYVEPEPIMEEPATTKY